jgi:hypothetical protein
MLFTKRLPNFTSPIGLTLKSQFFWSKSPIRKQKTRKRDLVQGKWEPDRGVQAQTCRSQAAKSTRFISSEGVLPRQQKRPAPCHTGRRAGNGDGPARRMSGRQGIGVVNKEQRLAPQLISVSGIFVFPGGIHDTNVFKVTRNCIVNFLANNTKFKAHNRKVVYNV